MADQDIKTGQMWPINGASKARRLKWGAAQNQISWAYMKMLREGNKTLKVYDVNPYIEVYQFYDNLYGLFNQNCDGAGDVWMWLIIGPEKAMLIDTACGLGDMKSLVDEITGGMPLIVANTHGHADHARGNCWFEKVYCYETLVPVLEAQNGHMWTNCLMKRATVSGSSSKERTCLCSGNTKLSVCRMVTPSTWVVIMTSSLCSRGVMRLSTLCTLTGKAVICLPVTMFAATLPAAAMVGSTPI